VICVGIDPGIHATGIVALGNGFQRSKVVSSTKNKCVGVVRDWELARSLRVEVGFAFRDLIYGLPDADVTVAIEGAALARGGFGSVQVGALHFVLYDELHAALVHSVRPPNSLLIVTVPPKTLKKYASGNGNADKDQMVKAISERWRVRLSQHDLYDAYALAKLAEAYRKGGDSAFNGKIEVHRMTGGEFTEVVCVPDSTRKRRSRRKRSRN